MSYCTATSEQLPILTELAQQQRLSRANNNPEPSPYCAMLLFTAKHFPCTSPACVKATVAWHAASPLCAVLVACASAIVQFPSLLVSSNIDIAAGCIGSLPRLAGSTCSWSCRSGYVTQGSSLTSTCTNGFLSQPGSCAPAGGCDMGV